MAKSQILHLYAAIIGDIHMVKADRIRRMAKISVAKRIVDDDTSPSRKVANVLCVFDFNRSEDA